MREPDMTGAATEPVPDEELAADGDCMELDPDEIEISDPCEKVIFQGDTGELDAVQRWALTTLVRKRCVYAWKDPGLFGAIVDSADILASRLSELYLKLDYTDDFGGVAWALPVPVAEFESPVRKSRVKDSEDRLGYTDIAVISLALDAVMRQRATGADGDDLTPWTISWEECVDEFAKTVFAMALNDDRKAEYAVSRSMSRLKRCEFLEIVGGETNSGPGAVYRIMPVLPALFGAERMQRLNERMQLELAHRRAMVEDGEMPAVENAFEDGEQNDAIDGAEVLEGQTTIMDELGEGQ